MAPTRFVVIFLAILFGSHSSAYAYLDPGTGAMVVQLLLGGIAIGFAYFSHKFQLIKKFFSRNNNKEDDKDNREGDTENRK